jgi:hypothetical protein
MQTNEKLQAFFTYKYSLSLQERHEKNNKDQIIRQGNFLDFDNLSLEISIHKHAQNTTILSELKVFGLSSDRADTLTSTVLEQNDLRKVILDLGFDTVGITNVYYGNIVNASFQRFNNDTVLNIRMRNGIGDIENTNNTYAFESGILIKNVVHILVAEIKQIGLKVKFITDINSTLQLTQNFSFVGNPVQALRKILYSIPKPNNNLHVIVHDMQFSIINLQNTFKQVDKNIIGGKYNSIIESPKQLDNFFIEVSTTLNPFIDLMDKVELQSLINARFNGEYIVVGIDYTGMLSQTVNSSLKTRLTLMQPQYSANWFATYT